MIRNVLIVDDDKNICELLRLYLEKEGWQTVCAYDGKQALEKFEREQPDFVLLDIMLPYLDGRQVCRRIRETSDVPILMLTAKGEVADKIAGLDIGADDYITKPFDTGEVLARMKAIVRRAHREEPEDTAPGLKYDGIRIYMPNYELWVKGKPVTTPAKELELLYFLASHPNQVFTRNQLLDAVWGFDFIGGSRTVDVHIKRLREKLDGVSKAWTLRTVWNVGYQFKVTDDYEEESV